VPAVLVAVVIAPVVGSIDKPAGAEKVPPVVPTRVTFWTPSVVHHGDPEYVIVAEGCVVTVTLVVGVLTVPHVPLVTAQ
jgi:hypothetical protein